MARSSRANVRRKDDKKKRKNHIEAARWKEIWGRPRFTWLEILEDCQTAGEKDVKGRTRVKGSHSFQARSIKFPCFVTKILINHVWSLMSLGFDILI